MNDAQVEPNTHCELVKPIFPEETVSFDVIEATAPLIYAQPFSFKYGERLFF